MSEHLIDWNEIVTQASCFAGPRLEEPFLPASLELVRRCPARSEYIELCFTISEGSWKCCFPEPARPRELPAGPLALTVGLYGVQVHAIRHEGLVRCLPRFTALSTV